MKKQVRPQSPWRRRRTDDADRCGGRARQGADRRSDEAGVGLRIGVKSKGCSGLSYLVEYARSKKKFEEVVEDKGVTLLIDPTAIMFLLGSEMDYTRTSCSSGFTFTNPNEKGRCGCGESFHV